MPFLLLPVVTSNVSLSLSFYLSLAITSESALWLFGASSWQVKEIEDMINFGIREFGRIEILVVLSLYLFCSIIHSLAFWLFCLLPNILFLRIGEQRGNTACISYRKLSGIHHLSS